MGRSEKLAMGNRLHGILKTVKGAKDEILEEAGFKSFIEAERAAIEAERAKQMDTWFHDPGHQLQ